MNALDLNPISRPASAVMPALPQDVMVLLFGALIVAALTWALRLALGRGDDRLLILSGCGAMAALLEGFACYLIQCYHAPVGEYRVYRAFDTDVPLWLAEVYVLFFGAAVHLFLRTFSKKPTAATFWSGFAVIGIGEGLFEMYGIHQGMFLYYGTQPLPILGFPLHLGFVNPALAMTFAAIAGTWFRFARGGARYLLIPLTPLLLCGLYASVITPVAAGLHRASATLALEGAVCTIAAALAMSLLAYWTLQRLQATASGNPLRG
ncbi:MAG: hypothetical protein JWQ90_3941 [Hydrocarboniphaga sp.]|uniref:hypothetical protein n=1 Tax=Hydrocarboniphaga sp. TaxID=2033016 RepID=UPI00263811CB|nr:hypothetical protein [Hydrocarboniphaga sp.]MDB5971491.1 hypothetical protein [Hydrocarboniphaga sp.]